MSRALGNASGTATSGGASVRADQGAVARTYRHTDRTTASDRLRIRDARAVVRAAFREATSDGGEAVQAIFRQEIGTNVRSASPFLLALIASQGGSLDQLVERIVPAPGWPRAPALSGRPTIQFRRAREPYREYVVSTPSGDSTTIRLRGYGHGLLFSRSGDDWACLDVVDHSLEVEVRIGPVKIETLFGVLRIELDSAIPETLAVACVGRPVGDVIDHAALHGQPWLITGIEAAPSQVLGQTLIVDTGSADFSMPWLRGDVSGELRPTRPAPAIGHADRLAK